MEDDSLLSRGSSFVQVATCFVAFVFVPYSTSSQVYVYIFICIQVFVSCIHMDDIYEAEVRYGVKAN